MQICSKLRSKLFLSAAIVCALLLFTQSNDGQNRRNERRARNLAAQGDRQFRQNNFRAAIENYAQAIALAPKVGYPRFWKGLAHYRLNEPDMALPEFDAALANGYNKPLDVYGTRWRIYYQRKEYDKALSDVRNALQLEPENQAFMLAEGDIAFGQSNFADALAAYQKYAAKNPANAEIHLNIAKCHQAMNNFAGQTAAAEEAIRRGTRNLADAHMIIGDGYEGQRKFPEAVEAYKRAVLARPDDYQTYQRLAEGYRALAKFDDAIETSRRALRKFPNNGAIYADISYYYSLDDRHQDAVDSAQAGIRYSPDNYLAYTNLCRAYNDLKRHDLAVAACNNALRLKPNDGESLYYLARATGESGNAAEAARLTKRAISGLEQFAAANPTNSDAHYHLGNAYYSDRQLEKALAAYERCLELSPNFIKALVNTGFIYLDQGKKDRATAIQRRLQQIDPKSKYAKLLLDEINK